VIFHITPEHLYRPLPFKVAIGPALTVARIKDVVAQFYGMRREHMDSAIRWQPVASNRQVAMYLARELTKHSHPNIGRMFGNRDHTTVMHACKRIVQMMQDDEGFAAQVDFLRERLAA
jgi:chromosomal replication initiator protein